MKLNHDKYMALAEMYLFAAVGQKVSGLIHNLNNHVHVADMQLAMLVTKSAASGDKPLADFKDRLTRASGATSMLAEILNQNSRFSFYTQKSEIPFNLPEYLEWLLEFWDNDQFFKHKVSCELIIETPGLHIKTTPFHLTSCLEQAIRNAVEACQESGAEGGYKMQIRAHPFEKGVAVAVKSFTRVPELDPWLEGSSSRPGRLGMGLPVCAWLASRMNWDIKLNRGAAETDFIVSIPG